MYSLHGHVHKRPLWVWYWCSFHVHLFNARWIIYRVLNQIYCMCISVLYWAQFHNFSQIIRSAAVYKLYPPKINGGYVGSSTIVLVLLWILLNQLAGINFNDIAFVHQLTACSAFYELNIFTAIMYILSITLIIFRMLNTHKTHKLQNLVQLIPPRSIHYYPWFSLVYNNHLASSSFLPVDHL